MEFVLRGAELFPLLLLLFGSAAAAPHENDFTERTTLPNYLPEEEPEAGRFTTTPGSRTAENGNQLLPPATPGAAAAETMAPTTTNKINGRLDGQATRLGELGELGGLGGLVTSLKPASTSPPPASSSTAPVRVPAANTTNTINNTNNNNSTTTTINNTNNNNNSTTTTINSTINSTITNTITTTTRSWTVRSTSSASLTTQKGPQCNCSAEGTLDPLGCDPHSGQCVCVAGYSGPQCDSCEDGYFTNGTSGCQPCGCDSFGALRPLCDSSGVCACKTGVYGDKCDDCRLGFFHFSNTGCQPCQCNNHTSICDTQSGTCVNCQGNTKGPSCEDCKYNFYRPPGSAPTETCLPCPCSSVTSTGSCTLDKTGQPVCDQCNPEYQGPNCEQCRDGFYNADSICVPCNCSGNAEPNSGPRICHPDTGHCLSCSYNTAGTHCEHCAQGFTGDALSRNCTAIVLTTLPPPTTMTPSPNSTEQLTTLSTALITSLASSTTNSTSATAADVSWAQFNVIVLAVIIVVLVVLMGVAGGVYTYREYQNRKLNAPFWTIELKEDNISFNSYHDSIPNADVSGLLEDEMSEVASNGQLTLNSPGNLYKA